MNRYDTPAQYNPIDTYVPIPFQEIATAVSYRQKKSDDMQNRLDMATENAKKLKYISGSADEEYIKNTVLPKMDEISLKYATQDLSNPVIARQMQREMRTSIDSNRVNDIQDSHGNWIQNQKMKSELKAKGLYRDELDQDPSTGYDTSKTGVFNYQTSAFENARPVGEQYFNNLENSILTNAKGQMLTTGRGYNLSGIDEAKIREVSTRNVSSFLDTNAGKQAVILAKNRHPEYGKLNDEQIAEEILFDIGKEKINTQLTGSAYPVDRNRNNNFPFDPSDIDENETRYLPNTKLSDIADLSETWGIAKPAGVLSKGMFYSPGSPSSGAGKGATTKTQDTEFYNKVNKQVDKIVDKYDLKDVSRDEARSIINKAYSGIRNQNVQVWNINKDDAENMLNIIGDDYNSVVFKVAGDKGIGNITGNKERPGDIEGLARKIGTSPDDVIKQLKSKQTLSVTNQGPVPAMIGTSLKGKNGEFTVLMSNVSGSAEQTMSFSNQLWNKYVNLDDSPMKVPGSKDKNGKDVYAKVRIDLDRSIKDKEKFEPTIEYGTYDSFSENNTYSNPEFKKSSDNESYRNEDSFPELMQIEYEEQFKKNKIDPKELRIAMKLLEMYKNNQATQ